LTISRALRVGRHRSDREAQHGRAESSECDLVLEHELEVELSEPSMFAGDLLGAGALACPQRVDDDPVLMLGNDQDLARARE
jgi:hypothetical protein